MDVKSERRKQGLSAEYPRADPDAVDVRANAAFNTPAKIAYFALFIFISLRYCPVNDAHPGG